MEKSRKSNADYQREFRERKKRESEYAESCIFYVKYLAHVAHLAEASGKIVLPEHDRADNLEIVRALHNALLPKGGLPI